MRVSFASFGRTSAAALALAIGAWLVPAMPVLAKDPPPAAKATVSPDFGKVADPFQKALIALDGKKAKLPASQEKLLEALSATGKPLVVVLLNGSAIAATFADKHANAVLEAWYPGEAGAKAIADTLMGANNPSGRLPLTFYASEEQLPPFADYSMKNRTYRYFTGRPLYGFGYGLSYTSFAYDKLKLSRSMLHAGESLTAEVEVSNTGKRDGEEVAQLYLMPPAEGNGGLSPKLQLEGFQRVSLKAGERRVVKFTLDPRMLSEVDGQGERAVQPGSYRLAIGGAQPGDSKADQMTSFSIEGMQTLPR